MYEIVGMRIPRDKNYRVLQLIPHHEATENPEYDMSQNMQKGFIMTNKDGLKQLPPALLEFMNSITGAAPPQSIEYQHPPESLIQLSIHKDELEKNGLSVGSMVTFKVDVYKEPEEKREPKDD